MADETEDLLPRLTILSQLQPEITASTNDAEKLALLAEMRTLEKEVLALPCRGPITALAKLKFARDDLRFNPGGVDVERMIRTLDEVMNWINATADRH